MGRNVRVYAFQDITEWMKEQNIKIQDNHGDVWVVTAKTMDCIEQSKLNAELGVHKVNYTKEAMNRKRVVN